MRVSALKFRENIYKLLDQALETGAPIEIVRKGRMLRVVPESKLARLARGKKRKSIRGNYEDIVHMNWLKYCSPKK